MYLLSIWYAQFSWAENVLCDYDYTMMFATVLWAKILVLHYAQNLVEYRPSQFYT